MDQQDRHVPTPEEIARAEAEAVKARTADEFVPYVDDVPEPEPSEDARSDEEDGDYVPGVWEARVAALPEKQWKWVQRLGGVVTGVAAVAFLTVLSDELGIWSFVLAFVLAMAMPNYLERWWRRKLIDARVAMLITIVVCLAAYAVYTGMTHGFSFFADKAAEPGLLPGAFMNK